jgi:hypothetical protein
MAHEGDFPEKALAILRKTKWNPQAKWFYEGMSGGLIWDDEFPEEALTACVSVGNWALRFVVGYRASLIRESPREELRASWDQLLRQCPQWPGFRPERRASELKPQLEAEEARFLAEFDALDAELSKCRPGNSNGESMDRTND